MTTTPARVLRRAATRFQIIGACWISTYRAANHGYAQIGWTADGVTHVVLAHRAAYEAAHWPIPAGMTVDHTCYERRCVNPDHLQLLTREANGARHGRNWPRVKGECGHMIPMYGPDGTKPWCRRCWRSDVDALAVKRAERLRRAS